MKQTELFCIYTSSCSINRKNWNYGLGM